MDKVGKFVDHHVVNGLVGIGQEPPGKQSLCLGVQLPQRVRAPVTAMPVGETPMMAP